MLILTPGNISDIAVAGDLLKAAGHVKRLIADRGYDADALRFPAKSSGNNAGYSRTAQPQEDYLLRQKAIQGSLDG